MTKDAQGRQRRLMRPAAVGLALAVILLILAVLIVPSLVSVSRYQSRITRLVAASVGRPVRLSSVELRLLPRPGFVLTDLTVEEEPAYGAEPLLHANTVTASIRLLSLWRGRLEISRISVDEASVNLVRTAAGRWNLESLFRTAAAKAQPGAGSMGQRRAAPLPYLEATNSRINIKSGAEKLPFSLVSTDLSFWQAEPGDWRVRLRGQPVRTDLSLDQADTGVVRLEASLRRAPELRQMPMRLDLEWREAQLGQLTRLVIGSDAGWRGDLTGEVHLDGTPEAAQITTRLRATGVHRAEFAPAAPMDFDARCGFVYRFFDRALQNLACDSPLGDGRIHIAGELPGEDGTTHLSVDLDRIPVAAVLDALRTLRSGFAPGLEAKGTIGGRVAYAGSALESGAPEESAGQASQSKTRAAKSSPAAQGPLTGSFTVEGLQLSGDGLRQPILVPRLVLAPAAPLPGRQPGQFQLPTLSATAAVSAGGTVPLTVRTQVALSGYQVTVRGQASLARARELARVAGTADATALDGLAGDPIAVDLSAEGPWLPAQRTPFSSGPPARTEAEPGSPAADRDAVADRLSGSVTLRNANWKADYLANHVEIAQATLHLDNGEARWDLVVFSYGPVKGTASLELSAGCEAPEPCPAHSSPRVTVQFGALDASTLQAAILGAHAPGTLLSTLIARLRPSNPSSAPAWPQLQGAVKADSLILGPVTLRDATATLRILESGAEITGLDASLLGGRVHGAGTLRTGDRPSYSLEGRFEKLSSPAVGRLLGLRWTGGAFDGDGKIELSGFTDKDLADSAKGTLHFDWRHGGMSAPAGASSAAVSVPPALAHFARWTADAEIANGTITLKQNQVRQGARKRAVEAAVILGNPPKVTFSAPRQTQGKNR